MSDSDFTQIAVGVRPVQVCPPLGKGSSVTVYNQDILNPVTVSRNNSVGLNASNGAPIQPLTSAVMDATYALYAVAPAGTAALIILPGGGSMSPSPAQIATQISALGLAKDTSVNAPSYGPPTHIDVATTLTGAVNAPGYNPPNHNDVVTTLPTNISTTGVPLLNNHNNLLMESGSLASSNSVSWAATITQLGYNCLVTVKTANNASTAPFVTCTLTWVDETTGLTVAIDSFQLAMGPTGTANAYLGNGPTKANQVSIGLTNQDPANAVTYVVDFWQNSRVYIRDDWRSAGGFSTVTAYSVPNSDIAAGLICESNPSVPNGGSVSRLLPLFCGKVYVCCVPPAQAGKITLTPIAEPQVGTAGPAAFSNLLVASTPFNAETTLMRANYLLVVSNTGAAAGNFSTIITVEEFMP